MFGLETVFNQIMKKIGDSLGDKFKTLLKNKFHKSKNNELLAITAIKNNLQKIYEDEINGLDTLNYAVNLNNFTSYLERAGKIFKKADATYAITICNVSGFWTRSEAKEYLKTDNDNIIRLFVFKTAENLMEYRNILNKNFKMYGGRDNKGIVLVTSADHYYNKIVGKFIQEQSSKECLTRMKELDFAVLECGETSLFIYLRNHTLGFQEICEDAQINKKLYRVDDTCHITTNTIKQTLLDIRNNYDNAEKECKEHHNCQELNYGFSHEGIFKWDREIELLESNSHDRSTNIKDKTFTENDEKFLKKCFKDVFTAQSEGIVHIVLIKEPKGSKEEVNKRNSEILTEISKTEKKIHTLMDPVLPDENTFECCDVWSGKYFNFSARDLSSKGKLEHYDGYKYILYMRFEDKAGLEGWYNHEKHSEIRRNLYQVINPKIKSFYDKFDKVSEKEKEKEFSLLIENNMKDFIIRLDFSYECPEEAILWKKAFPFDI